MFPTLTIFLLILVRIIIAEQIVRPTSPFDNILPGRPNPYIPARPRNSQTFVHTKSESHNNDNDVVGVSGEMSSIPIFGPPPPPRQPIFPSSSSSISESNSGNSNAKSVPVYSAQRIFDSVKPQMGDPQPGHDNNVVDTSSTFLTRHDPRERLLNTNQNWITQNQNGIHGSNFPEIDAEFFQAQPHEVILFRVSASGLPNADLFGGEADPFIQIYYSNGSSSDNFEHFYRTATLRDNHEPSWDEIVKFEIYLRGAIQTWKFELRDHDANDWDDLIGFAFINVDDCIRESRFNRIFLDESACSAQITGGNGVLSVQIL